MPDKWERDTLSSGKGSGRQSLPTILDWIFNDRFGRLPEAEHEMCERQDVPLKPESPRKSIQAYIEL